MPDTYKAATKSVTDRMQARQEICNYACGVLQKKSCKASTISYILRAMARHDHKDVFEWSEYAASGTRTSEDEVMKYFHGILRNVNGDEGNAI